MEGQLSFLGCNANIDLDWLLTLYEIHDERQLALGSIQFPNPHFKKQHAKRQVVTAALVTFAKFMREGNIAFLQSNVEDILLDMRERFCDNFRFIHFEEDGGAKRRECEAENPLGIPMERETNMLNRGLHI